MTLTHLLVRSVLEVYHLMNLVMLIFSPFKRSEVVVQFHLLAGLMEEDFS